jgi:hypothetical protein
MKKQDEVFCTVDSTNRRPERSTSAWAFPSLLSTVRSQSWAKHVLFADVRRR